MTTPIKRYVDNIRRLLERIEKNVYAGEADLKAFNDEIIKAIQKQTAAMPALVVAGNERYRAQNTAICTELSVVSMVQ